jgi:hypothetical protein
MRIWIVGLLVIAWQSAARAQPGMAAPNGRPVQLQLSAEDAEILERGEISDGAYVGGGVLAIFGGFGLGQAVQGRWSDTGWIFTLGETAGFTALLIGAVDTFRDCPIDGGQSMTCDRSQGPWLFWGGLIALGGLRIWELYDAWAVPPEHNRRLRELRIRLGMPPPPTYSLKPYLGPTGGSGGVAGLTLRF